MTGMLEFDADAARRLEEAFATPDIVRQRRDVLAALALCSGARVLDVGCGPGFLAAEMAAAVVPGAAVSGIDISEDMLTIARGREAGSGAAPLDLRPGGAEDLPFPDGVFDASPPPRYWSTSRTCRGRLPRSTACFGPAGGCWS
jgi:arsenite methyltransferase